jgi:hypothetical protein
MRLIAFSYAAVHLALGSQRCRRAHAVDGILTCSHAACSWLTALSACSCSRWHSHLQPCSLLLADGAVGVLMQSMAFSLAAVSLRWLTALSACSCSRWHSHLQPCSLLLAHGAVGVLMQSMALSCATVQLALAHGAVGVLMQSMAFSLAAVQPALGSRRCRPAHAACSYSRWHSHLQQCSLPLADGAVEVLMQ